MAKIQEEVKLDFKDVLIRPKRSTLKSRSQVTLERNIKMKHSGRELNCVPIIAANMDTVGTFEMAVALAKHKMLCAVHKHYSVDQWSAFVKAHAEVVPFLAVSSGISEDDFAKLGAIIKACPSITTICLDVANGYSEHFVNFVRKTRASYPQHTIIAGNVVTGEMVEELILSGADIVKVNTTRTPLFHSWSCITGWIRDLTTEGIEPNPGHPRAASSRRSRTGRVC